MSWDESIRRVAVLADQGRQMSETAPNRARPFFERAVDLLASTEPSATGDSRNTTRVVMATLIGEIGQTHEAEGELGAALGEYERAQAVLETADLETADPNMDIAVGMLERLGLTYHRLGQPAPALTNLHRALEIVEAVHPGSHAHARLHNNIAAIEDSRGDTDRALEHRERALAILERTAPRSPEALDVVFGTARAHLNAGRSDAAYAQFERALGIARELDPRSAAAAECLEQLGFLDLMRAELPAAQERFAQALAIREGIDPRSPQTASCLAKLAMAYRGQDDLGRSLQCYERALAIWKAVAPMSPAAADCLDQIAHIHVDREEVAEAAACFEAALAILQAIDPASAETAGCMTSLGLAHHDQGRTERAVERLEEALNILQAIGSRSEDTAVCLGSLGLVHRTRGDLAQAHQYSLRALDIWESLDPDSDYTATCLTTLGQIERDQGDTGRALARYERALAIRERIDAGSTGVAGILCTIGGVCQDQGDLGRSLDHLERALAIAEAEDPRSRQTGDCLHTIAMVYLDQGETHRARVHLERALDIFKAVAPRDEVTASCHSTLAAAYSKAGNAGRAVEHYERALAVAEAKDPSSPAVARCRDNIGSVYLERGDLDRALEHFTRALEIARASNPRSSTTAGCLNSLGMVHLNRGATTTARGLFEQALAILEPSAPRSRSTATVLSNLASTYRDDGDLDEAIRTLARSIEIVESLRARAGASEAKENVFAQHQTSYQAIISWLAVRGGPGAAERAFDYAERSRARALVELLAERQVELNPQTSEQEELVTDERTVQSQLAATHAQLSAAREEVDSDPELVRRLAGTQHELEERLGRVRTRLRAAFPAYAQLEYPEPLTLPEVQAALDRGTLLLEYDATGDALFVWAVRRDDFGLYPIEGNAETVASLVDASVGAYRDERAGAAATAAPAAARARAELARLLLETVPAERWRGVERVLVVPDGSLHYLPFEILPVGEDALLMDRFPIAYAPSFTALDNVRRLWRPESTPGAEFLGFGDPAFSGDDAEDGEGQAQRRFAPRGRKLARLPHTALEVARISQTVGAGARTYVGRDATEHRVRTESGRYRYLHFATHGLLDDENPLYSGLALAPPRPEELARDDELDDMLQVHEMFGLRLNAELVVCSACNTGLGRLHDGEGLVGMTRALLFAGARCVIVSLWPVPDAATARVMQDVYRELTHGRPIVEALRLAKAAERAQTEDPLYWGGFVAVGLGW